MVSHATKEFFRCWRVKHRASSAYFPHSNTSTELGMKAMKKLHRENTGPKGQVDIDKFTRAMLAYRNTPMQGVGLSTAKMVFGRVLKDTLPFAPGMGKVQKQWRIVVEDRERALAKRHRMNMEKLNKHMKELEPLKVGQSVLVQNKAGCHETRWAKTDKILFLIKK